MQNIEQANSDTLELNDTELDGVNGGSLLGAVGPALRSAKIASRAAWAGRLASAHKHPDLI